MIAGAAASYWGLAANASERHDVLILRQAVPAGEALGAEDLGVVAMGSEDGVPWVAADRFDEVVGQYARYQLASGALLVDDNLQAGPLVTPGRALVSVVVEAGDVPSEVGIGDDVVFVLLADATCPSAPSVSVVDATVTFVAGQEQSTSGSGRRTVAVSAEVDGADVAAVGTAAKVVVARPNSPEVAVAAGEATPSHNDGVCAATGEASGTGDAGTGGGADDPTVQQPVPTGVTPLDPSEVLVEPGS